jgi:1,4-dihydroxy-2-naphthoate octaprenyltransferase
LIGTATSALYSVHRIVGLQKTAHLITTDRFAIIRKYQFHIRVYTVFWVLLAVWLAIPFLSLRFILWFIPGGLIGFAYVIPFLPGGKRLRDLGWGKILMISWSWAWLTSVIPLCVFTNASMQMTVIHGLERLLFIMLIAIPFEIRDLHIDRSLGLITMPEKLGARRTQKMTWLLGGLTVLLSLIASFHYFNPAYGMAISVACLLMFPLVKWSYKTNDDYFFGGLLDGMMILTLWLFLMMQQWTRGWI